jgi:hypothetical protein
MRIAVCIIIFCLPITLSSQRVWNVHDTYGGPVKSVTIIEQTPADYRNTVLDGAYVKEGSPRMKPPIPIDFYSSRHYLYDEASNIVRHTLFDKHADTVGFCQWTYDTARRILDRKEFIGTSRLERQLGYEYPSANKSIQYSILPQGDTLNTHVIEVDTALLIRRSYNVHGDKIENMIITELKDDLEPVRSYSVNGDHSRTIYEHSYSSSGTLLMRQTSLPNANSMRCKTQIYDDHGHLVKQIFEYDNGKERIIEYENDSLGNVLLENVLSYTSPSQHIIRYEYEFNEYGDWTRKSKFREDDVNWKYHGETVLREITYY